MYGIAGYVAEANKGKAMKGHAHVSKTDRQYGKPKYDKANENNARRLAMSK
jgi:hypothetical protein